jgi:Ala-tRNA(Pro) deacylase
MQTVKQQKGDCGMEDQKQRVYDALDKLKIKYEVVEHEPVHTMEDMDRLGLPEKGTLCKNLFLRDSKGKRHFLVTCDEKKTVDLKSLGRQLGGGNLSFASEDRLEKYLGLKQGSVSPFGLMNDTDHAVEFFIDKDLSKCKSLGIHPLENTATVFLSFKDLDKFLWDLDVDVVKVRL